ncbi:MAG: TPM domain-containing protein [Bacteroidia bacterium]|nr:TPM domain-containing protein [Bacteroidia bacterium]
MQESIEDFLGPEGEQQVINAIREAELNTSGEIRVHLEYSCSGHAFERAQEVFSILGMDNTRQQNAVLIYVALQDHQFAICGDKGIDGVVPENFWDSTRDLIQNHFCSGNFISGLSSGIIEVGNQLKSHFPRGGSDINELPDSISTS